MTSIHAVGRERFDDFGICFVSAVCVVIRRLDVSRQVWGWIGEAVGLLNIAILSNGGIQGIWTAG